MAKYNKYWKNTVRKFDSKFEEELQKGILCDCEYHSKDTYGYTVSHKYHPDFIWVGSNGVTYLIESKGRFEDTATASKYRHIRDNLPTDVELVFLFQHPGLAMPRAQKRKDGTKASHKEWAERHKFQWFDKNNIKEILK